MIDTEIGTRDEARWLHWDNVDDSTRHCDGAVPHSADPEVVALFDELLAAAKSYRRLTGRHLEVFAELGELYAEIHYGVGCSRRNALLGTGGVAVRTTKMSAPKVSLRGIEDLDRLLVIRISDDYEFEAKVADRQHFTLVDTRSDERARDGAT